LSKHRHNAHCERYRLWLLKNSVSAPNKQNLGDRKCLGDLRKSLVGLPDAISFLRISREGVFQQPRLSTTIFGVGDIIDGHPKVARADVELLAHATGQGR